MGLRKGEIAVGILGGTRIVDGIAVSWGSLDSSIGLEPGHSYLLLGARCSAHEFKTLRPGFGFVSVDGSGRFHPLASQSPSVYPPFFQELMALGNVDALATRMRVGEGRGGLDKGRR